MRELSSYSAVEWLAFVPLVHRVKLVRNRVVERAYRAFGSRARDRFLAENAGRCGGKIAITIAFNKPWVIDLFLRSARRHLTDASIIVADNSSNWRARTEIAGLCRDHGVAYIPLPRNPEWSPNRSHGIAMNWVYYNIVRPLDPRVFAFLDHDLFPLSPFDLEAPLARQTVYGVRRGARAGGPWSLWAGFCMFDHVATRDRLLDFNYDRPLNLDTGGYNWLRLYRHLDGDSLAFANVGRLQIRDPKKGTSHKVAVIDGFAHVGGASYRILSAGEDRISFFRCLVAYAESGGRWQDLVLPGEDRTGEARLGGPIAEHDPSVAPI